MQAFDSGALAGLLDAEAVDVAAGAPVFAAHGFHEQAQPDAELEEPGPGRHVAPQQPAIERQLVGRVLGRVIGVIVEVIGLFLPGRSRGWAHLPSRLRTSNASVSLMVRDTCILLRPSLRS